MKDADRRDDIWDSVIGTWWLIIYGVAVFVVFMHSTHDGLRWLVLHYPAWGAIVLFTSFGILSVIIVRHQYTIAESTKQAPTSVPRPSDATILMPNDEAFDTDIQFLLIADAEQRRSKDE